MSKLTVEFMVEKSTISVDGIEYPIGFTLVPVIEEDSFSIVFAENIRMMSVSELKELFFICWMKLWHSKEGFFITPKMQYRNISEIVGTCVNVTFETDDNFNISDSSKYHEYFNYTYSHLQNSKFRDFEISEIVQTRNLRKEELCIVAEFSEIHSHLGKKVFRTLDAFYEFLNKSLHLDAKKNNDVIDFDLLSKNFIKISPAMVQL